MVFGGNKFCQARVGPKGICRGKCPRMQAKIRIFKASHNLTSDSCIQYAYRRVCILHASKPDSKCFQRKNAGEIQGHRTTGATFGTFHVDVKCLSISTIPMMVLPWSSDTIGPGGFRIPEASCKHGRDPCPSERGGSRFKRLLLVQAACGRIPSGLMMWWLGEHELQAVCKGQQNLKKRWCKTNWSLNGWSWKQCASPLIMWMKNCLKYLMLCCLREKSGEDWEEKSHHRRVVGFVLFCLVILACLSFLFLLFLSCFSFLVILACFSCSCLSCSCLRRYRAHRAPRSSKFWTTLHVGNRCWQLKTYSIRVIRDSPSIPQKMAALQRAA